MDASIFQSREWEEFKLKTGYDKSYCIDDILILQKRLPMGRSMLYSPMVSQAQLDSMQYADNRKLKDFLAQINKIAQENSAIFYRFELNIPKADICHLSTVNFIKSFEEMQPENNWVLDLTKSEEEILAEMKQKGRYNIKIAQSSGLTLTSSSEINSKELNAFYEQYAKTGQRHKISYRSKNYFETMLEILGGKGYARAYTVWHGKIALASAIIVLYGKSALYLYGGSSDEERGLMAPYLLHWEIIREAKAKGFSEYNFLGIAPDEDQNHPWAGITRFKKQFGGAQVDIEGCYDLPIKSVEYKIFKIAEKMRRHQ